MTLNVLAVPVPRMRDGEGAYAPKPGTDVLSEVLNEDYFGKAASM